MGQSGPACGCTRSGDPGLDSWGCASLLDPVDGSLPFAISVTLEETLHAPLSLAEPQE